MPAISLRPPYVNLNIDEIISSCGYCAFFDSGVEVLLKESTSDFDFVCKYIEYRQDRINLLKIKSRRFVQNRARFDFAPNIFGSNWVNITNEVLECCVEIYLKRKQKTRSRQRVVFGAKPLSEVDMLDDYPERTFILSMVIFVGECRFTIMQTICNNL